MSSTETFEDLNGVVARLRKENERLRNENERLRNENERLRNKKQYVHRSQRTETIDEYIDRTNDLGWGD